MTIRKHLVEKARVCWMLLKGVVMTSPVIAKSVGIGISIAKESNAVVMVTPALAVKIIINEPRKKPYYFPLNPGWLIGILIMVY